jgi:sugar-specific transcriptional regulator TrmB
MSSATDELTVVRELCVDVIEDARDELLLVIEEPNVSTRPAKDEDVVVRTLFVVVIDAASEVLLFVTAVCKPSILSAADELFVVIVPASEVIEELNDADDP